MTQKKASTEKGGKSLDLNRFDKLCENALKSTENVPVICKNSIPTSLSY